MSKKRSQITVWWPSGGVAARVEVFDDVEVLDITHTQISFSPPNSGGEVVVLAEIPWMLKQWDKR